MISASGAMLRMTPLMVPMKWSLVPKSVVNVTIGRFDKSLSVKTEISQYRENNVAREKESRHGSNRLIIGLYGLAGIGLWLRRSASESSALESVSDSVS